MVGLSGNGLAKACRRHGVQLPPRGYWQRLEAGQVIERAPPPENGHLETFVLVKGAARPAKDDLTGAMLRRRLAQAPAGADDDDRQATKADVSDECARILDRGMRQQLRVAAHAYLAGVAQTIPTLDEAMGRATATWVKEARAALARVGPAEDAAEALRAHAFRRKARQGWLSALVGASASATSTASVRARRGGQQKSPG
jgi:hypothetical protein